MKSDQTAQCDVLTHWRICTCCMSGCSVHTPVGYREVYFRKPKLVLNSQKNHELSDREECQEFQLLVVQLSRSHFVDEDECDRFPCGTASRFKDRLDSRARRFLRTRVLVVVVIVVHEEFAYILVESFSHVRRAFFCILVLLEQNQVADLVVVEHRLDSTWVPNVLYFDIFQVLLRRKNGPPRQSCHVQ